jgi:hypothetical protein
MVFSDLWAGRAINYTLATKFGGLAQRWGRARLKRGGAVINHGGEGTHIKHGRVGSHMRGRHVAPAWGEGCNLSAPHRQARLVSAGHINQVLKLKKKLCLWPDKFSWRLPGTELGLEKPKGKGS